MTTNHTILRAYELALRCRYSDAVQELKDNPAALSTPHGMDLYARVLYAAGQREDARSVWEELLMSYPGFEPAQKALSCDESAIKFNPRDVSPCWPFGLRMIISAVLAAALIAFLLGISCRETPAVGDVATSSERRSFIVATTTLTKPVNGKLLRSLEKGFLTNLTENTVLVIRGGRGHTLPERQKNLSLIAEAVENVANIPVQKMFFQPGTESSTDVILQVVRDFEGVDDK